MRAMNKKTLADKKEQFQGITLIVSSPTSRKPDFRFIKSQEKLSLILSTICELLYEKVNKCQNLKKTSYQTVTAVV